MQPEIYYKLAAGVDVVPLSDESILFRSNTLAVKIDGSMAAWLNGHVLPLLKEPRSLSGLTAQIGNVSADDLRGHLDSLVNARVLERAPQADAFKTNSPLAAFIENLGVDPNEAAERLGDLRVGIFGLEAHGAHLALELARIGVGACVLADSFPTEAGDELLMPPAAFHEGISRQQNVSQAIAAIAPLVKITLADQLSRDSVAAIAENVSVLVGCFDRRFETAHHWINRAAIATKKPALFSEISTHIATIGPHVLPEQSACYMCYRMRRVACEENYDEAMAYETFLNKGTQPSLSARATPPFLASHVASILAGELLKSFALAIPATLAGRILEFNALSLESDFHTVLRQPDCPVCGGEKKKSRVNPKLNELIDAEQRDKSGDLRFLESQLVSSRTGIVRRFETFEKDAAEPNVPYIVRADISNHRFTNNPDEDRDVCSGKGLTLLDARVSALGEAVERYSGAVHSPVEVLYARRSELTAPSIDPTDLALYDDSQYANLPYARYDDNRLGWVTGRSLVSGEDVLAPALAVFMNYHAHDDGEFLFPITSNGLAAGRTLLEAVLNATIEVLERDAFMIAWLNRLPARRFSPLEHPDPEIAQLAELYRRRNVEIRLYKLPGDHECHVFAGIALQQRATVGPAAVIGLGADLDPVTASRKAVLEVSQVRPALRRRMRSPAVQSRLKELLDDPQLVTTIDDHDLLYGSHDALPRLSFWLDIEPEPFPWKTKKQSSRADNLQQIVRWLADHNKDLVYLNLTPPDMENLGLYTARAILPGFQPIDFGWKERRLGSRRIYSLPFEIGLREQAATWDDLNHDPHPLA